MNEDALPGPAWAPSREGIGRPRFDPSVYDPTFVPSPPAVGPGVEDRLPSTAPSVASADPAAVAAAFPGADEDVAAAAEAHNAMATASLVLGLCSILIPLLAVPGVVLGIISLRRLQRLPSLSGRTRAVAGIATSLLFGTVSTVVLVVLAGGG